MARGATWGPWPPPHAHGSAQQQCPIAQAGPGKGPGQPMTPNAVARQRSDSHFSDGADEFLATC